MKKGMKRAIWAVVVVVIAVFLFLRLTKKEEFAQATADPVVTVETPHMGDVQDVYKRQGQSPLCTGSSTTWSSGM